MVQRRDDPTDRRIWRLYLGKPALAVLEKLHAERANMVRMVTAEIDPAMLKTLQEGLSRMKSNVVAAQRPKTPERGVA